MHFVRISVSLLVVVFYVVTPPATLAGCGVNFEKMKAKRIEAIRGQILSKLGFTQLPPEEKIPGKVPRDIEAMYNRTRDFVDEQARLRRIECEEHDIDYYAQEVITVHSIEQVSSQSEVSFYKSRKLAREISEFFEFDLESLKLDADAITSATLRFYQIPNPRSESGTTQQVDLHQLTLPLKEGHSPGRHFLDMRVMDTIGSGWESLDVTTTVRDWIEYPHTNLGLELTVPCPEDESSRSLTRRSPRGVREKMEILFAGSNRVMAVGRGDRFSDPDMSTTDKPLKDRYPQLVLMMRSAEAQRHYNNKHGRRRAKRSLDAEYCFNNKPGETNCCLRKLYIDFRKDLGWDWVHAPSGYNANFCAGACPYMWSMDTQHATILSLYKSMNPKASASPCCVPKELNPLTIMYYNQGRYQVTRLSEMVLLSCKCS